MIRSQGYPDNNLPWLISCNFALFFILLNIQLAMSADRVWVVCFPLSYATHKDVGYRKWVIAFCILIGSLIGLLGAVMMYSRANGDVVHDAEISFDFKTVAAIWAVGVTTSILTCNIFVVFKNFSRVNQLKLS